MTSFQLKCIAIFLMTLDHAGKYFFGGHLLFTIPGRLAFPLFAWFLAIGYRKTRNVNAYLKRIFLFALLSQIPYSLMTFTLYKDPYFLNVFVTLGLGLWAIHLYERSTDKVYGILLVAVISFASFLLRVDYALFGVLCIFLFHVFLERFPLLVISQSILWLWASLSYQYWPQLFCLLALIFIPLYNGQLGRTMKYFFYGYYPAHLILLYLIHKTFV